jgi:hypothetical protein
MVYRVDEGDCIAVHRKDEVLHQLVHGERTGIGRFTSAVDDKNIFVIWTFCRLMILNQQ